MIQRDFRDPEGAEAIRFSHGQFGLVVQALNDAAREPPRPKAGKFVSDRQSCFSPNERFTQPDSVRLVQQ